MAKYTTRERSPDVDSRRIPDALGQSESFLDFQARLAAVAPVERPVLIIGERGTGKELAAARLHFLSKRWQQPMLSINCAALSPSLIESELFGHEAGAFTGAASRRAGRFEMADGGTLFLDELGLMPMSAQEKVLRVTEYGVFERVGGTQEVQVDVRIVGATNADLDGMVKEKQFKADLLDRLSFEVLHIPPLRARRGDIALLALHFASRMAGELGLDRAPEIHPRAIAQLEEYPWPGNVRELKNLIERAVYQSAGRPIRDIDFQPLKAPWSKDQSAEEAPATGEAKFDLGRTLAEKGLEDARLELERRALEDALAGCDTQTEAAEKLRLSYNQFRALYRKHKS
ncbi:MAG: sigma 54-interacting transcriptional regulator [Opitutales bacterium]|jgi:psp operon transcriptional activator